jgi:hypothetical protein
VSHAVRPKPVAMTVCDLCDKEIGEDRMKQIAGKLAGHFINPDASSKTPRVYFLTWLKEQLTPAAWPPGHALGTPRGRSYDFHYECIERLVREAVEAREASSRVRSEEES